MVLSIVLAAIVIYLTVAWLTQRPKNFPPGPPVLPIIGCVPFIPLKHTHLTMAGEWRKKYGSVVGLIVGIGGKMVAVCGPKEVLEVLKREEFQGRPKGDFLKIRSFNKYLGVFFSDGPFWVEQRRFTIRNLRDFGFGKKSMEGAIMEEVEDAIKEVTKEQVFQVSGTFAVSTLNVLWGMIAGQRYSRDDAELQELVATVTRVFRSGSPTGGLAAIFPILRHIIPGLIGHTESINSINELQNFFRKSVEEHKKTIDENNPRDFIDAYLREMKLQSNNPDSTFTDEGLIIICMDLFNAGAETTTSSIGFVLLYMILYPEIQEKVQKELDSVVGQNRRPSLDDRQSLHYVEAVLTEVLRVRSIAPVTPPHRATCDTHLNGYFIPKDTMMMVNIYSLCQDKEHWGDPEVFRPERFLDSNGKFVKDEWMIPFGIGKRVCLGEVMARTIVYLFCTSLLQEFTFTVPEGDPKPSDFPLSGFTLAPQPYRVKVTKRF